MSLNITAYKQHLLLLPIVLTEEAWLSAVHIHSFLFAELNERLNTVLTAAYRALLQQDESDSARNLDFGVDLYPASGQRDKRVWLNLQVQIEYLNHYPHRLRVDVQKNLPPLT